MKSRNQEQRSLTNKLIQLQYLTRKNPELYVEEFKQQLNFYKTQFEIFNLNPTSVKKHHDAFLSVLSYLCHVSHLYPKELVTFPDELMHLLNEFASLLNPDMRLCLCKSLATLRTKGVIECPQKLFTLFFNLVSLKDKVLRNMIKLFLISNIASTFHKLSSSEKSQIQGLVLSHLNNKHGSPEGDDKQKQKVALFISIKLFIQKIWNDEVIVNAIANHACFSKHSKISFCAMTFFLDLGSFSKSQKSSKLITELRDSSEDEEERKEESKRRESVITHLTASKKFSKKTKSAKAKMEKTLKALRKSSTKTIQDPRRNHSAIHMLYDPQTLVEKLFKTLDLRNEKFELRAKKIELISQLIGLHQLLLLNFYSYICRYLTPRQTDVTKFLLFSAQACHEFVPPDVVEMLIKTISENFVSDANSAEVITVGLNAIREISSRSPLAMNSVLFDDLQAFNSHKIKNVKMAAKSLINLFRKVNPTMLSRKNKAKPLKNIDHYQNQVYGERDVKTYVEGSECIVSNYTSEIKSSADVQLDPKEIAKNISSEVIFDQNDFDKIKSHLISQKLQLSDTKKTISDKLDCTQTAEEQNGDFEDGIDIECDDQGDQLPTLSAIEKVSKVNRENYQDRKEKNIKINKARNTKKKSKARKKGVYSSLSNKEKLKLKPFLMMRKKIMQKGVKKSFKKRCSNLKASLLHSNKK